MSHPKGEPCTPLTPIVWVKCCRSWPIVPGYRVGTCGICGTVPVERADQCCAHPSDSDDPWRCDHECHYDL